MNEEPMLKEYPKKREDLGASVVEHVIDGVHFFTGFNWTDNGNANRLIALYGDRIRFCTALDTWFIWDGKIFKPDTVGAIFELAKTAVQLIHVEAGLMPHTTKSEKARHKQFIRFSYKSEAYERLKMMIKAAETDSRINVRSDELNANGKLMSFQNGTMDFEKREFREHRQSDLITKITRDDWNPMAASRYFYQTLEGALEHDAALYLQRLMGSMLEYTTKNKELLFIYGAPYAAKSSITQCVYAALGDYVVPVSSDILRKLKSGYYLDASRPHPELMALVGARIAWCEEINEGFILNDGFVKMVTSGGTTAARDLREKQGQITLGCSFVVECNVIPVVDAQDEWQKASILERCKNVNFMNTIPEEQRDKEVFKIMLDDRAEREAALAWVVQGFFDRVDYGLDEPEVIRRDSSDVQRKVNPLYSFVKEEIQLNHGVERVETPLQVIIDRFNDTADMDVVRSVKGPRSFNIHFKDIITRYAKEEGVDVTDRRTERGKVWVNVGLVDEDAKPTQKMEPDPEEKMTQNGKNDAKYRFTIKIYDLYSFYKGLYENRDLRHFSGFASFPNLPAVKIEGLSVPDFDKDRLYDPEEKMTQNDAKSEPSENPFVRPEKDVSKLRETIAKAIQFLNIQHYSVKVGFKPDRIKEMIASVVTSELNGTWQRADIDKELDLIARDPKNQEILNRLTKGAYFLAL